MNSSTKKPTENQMENPTNKFTMSLGAKKVKTHKQKHQGTNGTPTGKHPKQVYFFTWGEKVKTNEKHEQQHQENNGKSNGKPSKQVYFFTCGEQVRKKQKTMNTSIKKPMENPMKTFQTSLLFHLGRKKKHIQKHQ